jgi:hypothetical protein
VLFTTPQEAVMDVPELAVRPPIRCFHRRDDRPGAVCGSRANWLRVAANVLGTGYYCDTHHADGDVPIARAPVCRRVSVTLEVLLTGTSFVAGLAQADAVAALEGAVESVGGVVNLHTVHSVVGQYGPRALPGAHGTVGEHLP